MKKNVIITGATSFIGLNLISELVNNEYKIIAVIRPNSKKRILLEKYKSLKIIELEMQQYKDLNLYIDNISDSVFINLAWNGTRGIDRDNINIQNNNYKYSIEAIKHVVDNGCKMIINAGSQAEYGEHKSIISENTKCNPSTEYGKNKYRLFLEALNYCNNNSVSFKEARFFSIYGAFDSKNTMIISILNLMLKNEPCILTKCNQIWNFLHVKDAVRAIRFLIEKGGESGAYNIGSSDTRILKRFIEELYSISESKSELMYGELKSNGINLYPDINKLTGLGWRPEISFKEGIIDIIEKIRKGEN